MTTAPRWTEYVALDDIQPAESNPKRHSPDIGTSLDRFGYVEAMTLDERTGRLVAGHGRVEQLVAKQLAGDPPPDGITVAEDGRWMVPVQRGWSSRDDGEAGAYLLASNELSSAGGWDVAALDRHAADLAAREVDLSGLGFPPDAFAPPDFGPEPGGGQPRLDQRNPVICPACQHEFHPR